MKKITLLLALIIAFSSLSFSGCGKNHKTSYDIDVVLNGNIVSGSEKVCFYNNSDNTFKELKFNLYPNAFRENAQYKPISPQHTSQAYYEGINYGNMTINKVKKGESEIPFKIGGEDENILIVPLEKELFPEESVTIEIDFTVKLAKVVSRTGINPSTINLADFYPKICGISDGSFYECVYYSNGDPFFSEVADYDVTLTCDKKYVVASSGKVEEEEIGENNKKTRFTIKDARSFTFVLSENFKVLENNVKDINVKYYYYNDETPEESFKAIERSLNLFSEKFGDYIYENYSVAETEFVAGGMEYSALTMISDNIKGMPYLEVIAHETAHQWWQTAVGNNEIEHSFLDEGLAEYSVVIFYENYSDYGYTRENLIKAQEDTFRLFCSVHDKVYHEKDTSMLRPLKDYKTEYEYVNIAYIKPVIMYEYLRQSIGDKKFFNSLERYYKTYKKKIARPEDLVGIFEKTGSDTNGFFDTFFKGKEII